MINIKFKYKIKEVARKFNLPESVIEEIFNSQFKFYRETIKVLDFKSLKEKEEFDKLKTIFLFKYIGKFYADYRQIHYLNNHKLKTENKNEEN